MYTLLQSVRQDKRLIYCQLCTSVFLLLAASFVLVSAMTSPSEAQRTAAVSFVRSSIREQFRIAMIVGDALGVNHVYVYSKDLAFDVNDEVSIEGRTYRYKRSGDAVGVLSVAAQSTIADADDFFALAPGPRSRVKDGVIVVPANLRDYFKKQERKQGSAAGNKN